MGMRTRVSNLPAFTTRLLITEHKGGALPISTGEGCLCHSNMFTISMGADYLDNKCGSDR